MTANRRRQHGAMNACSISKMEATPLVHQLSDGETRKYGPSMQYHAVYSSKKRNGILDALAWRNLENMQEFEKKKARNKDLILYDTHLNEMSETGKSMQTESRSVITQG